MCWDSEEVKRRWDFAKTRLERGTTFKNQKSVWDLLYENSKNVYGQRSFLFYPYTFLLLVMASKDKVRPTRLSFHSAFLLHPWSIHTSLIRCSGSFAVTAFGTKAGLYGSPQNIAPTTLLGEKKIKAVLGLMIRSSKGGSLRVKHLLALPSSPEKGLYFCSINIGISSTPLLLMQSLGYVM